MEFVPHFVFTKGNIAKPALRMGLTREIYDAFKIIILIADFKAERCLRFDFGRGCSIDADVFKLKSVRVK